jgi:hypothetical protein
VQDGVDPDGPFQVVLDLLLELWWMGEKREGGRVERER